MPPCLRATPQQGRGGRGDLEGFRKQRKIGEGYDSSIPVHFRKLIDEWEVDAVSQQLEDPNANGFINHYWMIKNTFSHSLFQHHSTWEKARKLTSSTQHSFEQDRESLVLLEHELEIPLPHQEISRVGDSKMQTPVEKHEDNPPPLIGQGDVAPQVDKQENKGWEDPVQLLKKKMVHWDMGNKTIQYKHLGFQPKEVEADTTSGGFPIIEEILESHASAHIRTQVMVLFYVYLRASQVIYFLVVFVFSLRRNFDK